MIPISLLPDINSIESKYLLFFPKKKNQIPAENMMTAFSSRRVASRVGPQIFPSQFLAHFLISKLEF
jgi:hypothetical protein